MLSHMGEYSIYLKEISFLRCILVHNLSGFSVSLDNSICLQSDASMIYFVSSHHQRHRKGIFG